MSEQLPPLPTDKEKLWGWWYQARQWQDKLHRAAAHKALDIPEDMGDINAPKTMIAHNGISPLGLAALGAVGLAGYWLATKPDAQTPAPPAASAPLEDRDYEIRFYDKDGKLIDVPRFQTK